MVNPFGATKKLHDLGTRLVAASPHQDAVCFCVRQPPQGEHFWTLTVWCACKEASCTYNEHGQVAGSGGLKQSTTGRYAECPFKCVLRTTRDFGGATPPFKGAMRIVVAELCTQHKGHVRRTAAQQQACNITPLEVAMLKVIIGPQGGADTTRAALKYLNSQPSRKDASLTTDQLADIRRDLEKLPSGEMVAGDVHALVASMIVAGAGFCVEFRGASAAGTMSATGMIVRELDKTDKLFFINNPATFEETMQRIRNADAPALGAATDDECV